RSRHCRCPKGRYGTQCSGPSQQVAFTPRTADLAVNGELLIPASRQSACCLSQIATWVKKRRKRVCQFGTPTASGCSGSGIDTQLCWCEPRLSSSSSTTPKRNSKTDLGLIFSKPMLIMVSIPLGVLLCLCCICRATRRSDRLLSYENISHCKLSRAVRCTDDKDSQSDEIVLSAAEQKSMGIECPCVYKKHLVGIDRFLHQCSREPVYDQALHPVANWCPWNFWSEWSFACRDQVPKRATPHNVADLQDIPSDAKGVFLSTRNRQCSCPGQPGSCSAGAISEHRWRLTKMESDSRQPNRCRWCVWSSWTSCDCSLKESMMPRARFRDCACSNGTVWKSKRTASTDIGLAFSYINYPCFGLSMEFSTCSKCYDTPRQPAAPEYPKYTPPDLNSSGNDGHRALIVTLVIFILAIVFFFYYARRCCCISRLVILDDH
uniref:EGF-like domain-containing protein n=1 Tax=Macrostomum lignano TaxID=282301 RepID=A0A1I8G500_9PLAT